MRPDYAWLNDDARLFLRRGYLENGVEPEERYRQICEHAEAVLKMPGFADRMEHCIKRGWFSLASPIVSNFGVGRGLPISCNGSYFDDTMESILYKTAEIGMMTKHGAGTSVYLGAIRPRGRSISVGGESAGPVHFAGLPNTMTDVVSQSNIRRGSCAAYLPVEHPDIDEFLQIRKEGHPIQHLHFAVTITDAWMNKLKAGDKEARAIWAKIVQKRFETGYPYLFFVDNANNGAPECYRNRYKIVASNLCCEISLPSTPDESFVCCLSSLNLRYYDEWVDTDAVEVLTFFLDAVMSDYIEKVRGILFMESAFNFAVRHRAIGIGVLGWHDLLQSQMIAFDSMEANLLNTAVWKKIKTQSYDASEKLGEIFGVPVAAHGSGRRNTTTMAVAPTTSSSFILGQTSPSIEPHKSNYYMKDLAKGKFPYKNPFLKEVLAGHGKDTPETWKSILTNDGSVQHLGFLTEHEKNVFKTFGEISQKAIVIQAAGRQKYIDQGQSLNLMIHPNTSPKQVTELLIFGWEQGVKGFYYHRGTNPAQELAQNLLTCASCES